MATQFQKDYLHYIHGRETYAFSPKEKAYFICAYVDSQIIYTPVQVASVPKKVIEQFQPEEKWLYA